AVVGRDGLDHWRRGGQRVAQHRAGGAGRPPAPAAASGHWAEQGCGGGGGAGEQRGGAGGGRGVSRGSGVAVGAGDTLIAPHHPATSPRLRPYAMAAKPRENKITLDGSGTAA